MLSLAKVTVVSKLELTIYQGLCQIALRMVLASTPGQKRFF